MINPPVFLFNGTLCVVCAWFASCAKEDRREAVLCSLALAGNILFCALALTPLSPRPLINAFGLGASIKDIWMFADTALGGVCVMLGYRQWWGYALWLLCVMQIGLHAAMALQAIDGATYSRDLDIVLHAQMAVFFAIGGKGVCEFLHSRLANLRFHRWSEAAQSVAAKDAL